MRRISGLLWIFLLLAPALGQAGRKSQPDVFLVTIDTLRADHLGCYGYKQVETPTLDALAAAGVRFSHAFTHSPITNTSHTSIMTGLLPSVHGVTDFAVPLSPDHATMAELLKKNGYQTAAFIGAVILDSNSLAPGLDRGFDFYDNFPKEPTTKERWGRVERRGMTVVEDAESWLAKHPSGPRFVWVHLFDPHDPYEPPPPYSEKYKDHLYDGEIAYADSALGRWIADLKKAGAYQNAVIIVVGDHGEGLGEHGEDTHGLFLYDSTLHVPLIVKLPGDAHSGMVVDTQVRTTDILPTVLSATNIPAPAELNGETLIPLIEKQSAAEHILFSETDYPLRFGWAPIHALRAQDMKLIQAPRPELYDLKSDPGELKNQYAADDAQVRTLNTETDKWEAKLPANAANKGSQNLPDAKDKVAVQNMLHNAMLASDDNRAADARGFLEKAVQLDPSSATAQQQLGENQLAAGDYANAATHLKKACELRPDDSTAQYELGQALEKAGDHAGARDALEASLKLQPSQMPARLMLGRVYLQLKDGKNAEDQFEAAQLEDSNNVEARLGLDEAQVMQSKFSAALADLEALSKENPPNAEALHALAKAYRGLGRAHDAEQAEAKAAQTEKK